MSVGSIDGFVYPSVHPLLVPASGLGMQASAT